MLTRRATAVVADYAIMYGENSGVYLTGGGGMVRYRDVQTDRQTDRQNYDS